jgi:hypothetical protein
LSEPKEEVGSEDVVRVPEDDVGGDPVGSDVQVVEAEVTPGRDDGGGGAVAVNEDAKAFRSRWNEIQVRFVEDPKSSVQEAEGLVTETMQWLAKALSEERTKLESQWERGDDASTEDLRLALQRYRSFFNRLLSA